MKKALLLSFIAGLLLIFSFPNFNLSFLAWFAFVPLFLSLRNQPKAKAFLLAYFTGVIFWFGAIYWLVHVTLAGLIALVLYLSLYFGIFGLFVSAINRKSSATSLFFIPAIWVLLEYIRSHLFSGFGWALLGHAQYLNLPVIQFADIAGVYGVSFLVMMVNVAIWKRKKMFAILCLILVLTYGAFRLNQKIDGPKVRISVIQGNIPQELKWLEEAKIPVFRQCLNLSRSALADQPGLIIWPETAITTILGEEPLLFDELKIFAKEINTPLLVGAARSEDNNYYNSAILVSREGEFAKVYDKLHLVPFGEYIPLRNSLRFLEKIVPIGDFTPGAEYTIFATPINKFSVLICFEDIIPELSRKFVKNGAQFLVNITNDAWFKKTSEPYQHLANSVFRAIENRVSVVRSANTGVSAFIDPTGRIVSSLPIYTPGYISNEVIVANKKNTFYTRFGDVFVLICLMLAVCGIIGRKVNKGEVKTKI